MWERINNFVHSRVIISACILCIAFYSILATIPFPLANITLSGELIVRTIILMALSAIVVWLMLKMQVFNINDFKLNKMGKGLFLICVGILFAVVGFLFLFTQLPDNRFIAPKPFDFLAVAFSQLVGVGIYEELLFRGLILKLLLLKMVHSKRGIINACVISSIIFGVSHVGNIIGIARIAEQLSVGVVLPVVSQVIFTTAFGVLAVALFLRSGTIWIPILIHGVGNLVAQTFFAFISRERIYQFAQTPIEMSISEFFTSTLMNTIPLLVVGLFLLRKVKSDDISYIIPERP